MPNIDTVGKEWLAEEVESMADSIERMTPVTFNEENRYLPQGVSPRPGFIRYDLFPFLREIIECFDPFSPVREVNLMKGVQTGYTTLLESILLYYIAHIKTQAAMFITADSELASGRMENNILPMINESGFSDLIRSSDEGNSRKTGKTKDFLQWDGGGFLIYNGALNAAKMRQYSVPLMLKDELDGWKRSVGKDGNSDSLTDARLSAYWAVRKILRGSTPLLLPSMIQEAYLRGDQRKYLVLCKACSFPQELRQQRVDPDTGAISGFMWDTEDGALILESVRYCCQNCGHEHFEYDKEKLFATESGAHWDPTAKPKEPGIRSYHLPAFYSPYGFRPWYKGISDYLDSFDPETKQVKSISKFQEYYNNTLGRPFEVMGAKIRFTSVSAHRRAVYRRGQIPNVYAAKFSGSPILFLSCKVDVHKKNLAVSVFGWARDSIAYLIDYWRFERKDDDDDCSEISSPVWGRLRELIEEKEYTADDGKKYRVVLTFIDAGYANDTVNTFCSDYTSGVYPILGRDRSAKNQTIKEFAEFETQLGTVGYRILVDHYKDRLAPVLRREWVEDAGRQKKYNFNAPIDLDDKELKELTVESRRKKLDDKGNTVYFWYRPGNAPNELWDLLVYGHAGVDVLAWTLCIQHFELDKVDWPKFWDYLESEKLYFVE
jgi:phage terminase large subunit GpA-like protein